MATYPDSGQAGDSATRTAAQAVERELRRQAAQRDAEILKEHGAADDLDDLVAWSVQHMDVASEHKGAPAR